MYLLASIIKLDSKSSPWIDRCRVAVLVRQPDDFHLGILFPVGLWTADSIVA